MLKTLLVGEAYGENEMLIKPEPHPFVGAAGQELARMLGDSGLGPKLPRRENNAPYSIYDMMNYWQRARDQFSLGITNVFRAHPPDNNLELFFGLDGNRQLPPLKAGKYILPEFMPHVIRLWDEVKTLKPNLVVALGNTASWALLGRTYISRLRGTITYSERTETKILPTYHSSYIIRGGWPERPIVVADFRKALRQCEFPEVRRPERWLLEQPSLAEIEAWLSIPAKKYSIDIESGYALYDKLELKKMTQKERYFLSSQISMVGFARNPSNAMIVEFMSREKPGLCFWPDVASECAAWKLVLRGLKSPVPKTFQNGTYDITRFLEMGLVSVNCKEDTILRQHARYPEFLKNLGFQASIYCDDFAWKEIYHNRETLKRDD